MTFAGTSVLASAVTAAGAFGFLAAGAQVIEDTAELT